MPQAEDHSVVGIIGHALAQACPLARPGDAAAWQLCADNLTNLVALRDAMNEPFFWGQQAVRGDYDLTHHQTTRFNPFVWRRIYLSLFMFSEHFEIERIGGTTVLHLPFEFRTMLDAGMYPYPFWHSIEKWKAYQQSEELLFVFYGGKLRGALRSAKRAARRTVVMKEWDFQWYWRQGAEPHVSLYSRLFSSGNPYVSKLDAAYRALEAEMREHTCMACHSPDNAFHMNPLELLSYPNQALMARHTIREQIEQNRMPPATGAIPAGIADESERVQIIELARAFELAADEALVAEGEFSYRNQ